MNPLRFIVAVVAWLVCQMAMAGLPPELAARFASDSSDDKIAAVSSLAAQGDEAARRVLRALGADAVYVSGDRVLISEDGKLLDAETGQEVSPAPENPESVSINNRVRGELNAALAGLRLFSDEPAKRLEAAKEMQGSADVKALPKLLEALQKETDDTVRAAISLAAGVAGAGSSDPTVRLEAVKRLAESSDANTRTLLANLIRKTEQGFAEPDENVRFEAEKSLRAVETRLAFGDNAARIFTGVSLASILLLAALGLAITYGVMGVINMAHGELLMVGAYTTYLVQGWFRAHAPGAVDGYVVAAAPLAFLAAALVGMALERLVIRHLYGRPLETLLATWGISLCLIQAARIIFGPQNVELSNPSWMSGGIEIMTNVILPWNRIVIIAFTLAVLALVWGLMNGTRLGMFVRAVTQNRPMAGCVGVPTGRVDTLAFGLGAGLAGLGGCALSQIANVGPDMGQGYIIDSFLVVVVGGVGQLAGAVWAALGLGVLTKFLEGWSGAVIAKIIVLVIIIFFIQKRPQGLFALKGRFVES